MKSTKILMLAAMSAAVASYAASASADHHEKAGAKAETEKCYGVAKAGKNDCKGGGVATCAGGAKKDGEGFVLTPKGLCDKLAGGSTTEPKK
jgi:uncharacterized membrane protein